MKRRTKANGNEKKVVFRKFDSVTELSEFIKNTPQTKEGEENNWSVKESDYLTEFAGTRTFLEAERLLIYGDSRNAENVRKNIEQIGYKSNFTIIDSDDSLTIIKKIIL